MVQLAIKGHATRGKEVIEILEMLGGKNINGLNGNCTDNEYVYKIDWYDIIVYNNCITDGYSVFTLEEFLEKYPFKVGDFVSIHEFESKVRICKMRWKPLCNSVEYLVYRDDTLVWYSTRTLLEYNTDTLIDKEGEKKSLLSQLIEYFRTTPKDELEREWNEHNELDEIGPTVEEYIAFVESIKKQSKYPKTYEECCKVLGVDTGNYLSISNLYCDNGDEDTTNYELDLLTIFDSLWELRICRDAYWKIAGEQMGLEKPWEPDWKDSNFKYCLKKMGDNIEKTSEMTISCILAFPTAEMRDIFYDNFKDLIETCKGLL